ncbi:MAG: ribosome biogenesis GTPase Der [Halanaerobiaceae bacterium]
MSKPIVAIVGRPNVGKSTLFNRLAGNRIAIVEGEPSITRDRIYADAEWLGRNFILVDTGGIEPGEDDNIIKNSMQYQARLAMEEAEVILFVVDGRAGLTALDEAVAQILRETRKTVIPVVNKIDNFNNVEELLWEFYSLGFGDPIPVSAEHGKNTGDLQEAVVENLPPEREEEIEEPGLQVAIVGKPNVGKSSLVNYLLGHERVIVSDIPGTTRDAIDTLLERDGEKFNLIDTAGLRKKARVKEDVEYYSNIRAIRAIERSEGVIVLINAPEGVTEQDQRIVGYAHEAGKAIVLAINKWDLIEKDESTMDIYRDEVYYHLKFARYAPVTFISALTGERAEEVLSLIAYTIDQNSMRVKTGLLNEVMEEAVQLREPPTKKGKRLKLYYASQVEVKPPTFVLFVNDPRLMHFAYRRYLENVLRNNFGFVGSPIRIKLKQRS